MRISIFFIMTILLQILDILSNKNAAETPESLPGFFLGIFLICLWQDIKELFN